jgi:hypothetical protein
MARWPAPRFRLDWISEFGIQVYESQWDWQVTHWLFCLARYASLPLYAVALNSDCHDAPQTNGRISLPFARTQSNTSATIVFTPRWGRQCVR